MFREHGEFVVTRQGNILVAQVFGAWNAETAKSYKEAILKNIEPLKGKDWALISNVEKWELCTPDCQALMMQLIVESKEKGLKREAIVNSNTQSVKLDLFTRYSNLEPSENTDTSFLRQFVKTNIEAENWLQSEGFSQQ